jgi:small conductance mechanosensitive channel
MNYLLQEFWHRAEANAGRMMGALVILILGLLALRYLTPPFRRLLERSRMEPSIVSFLSNTVWALILIVMTIGALQQLGVETASLLTVLGAAGLAVALSLQNTLANFTAGLLLLSFRMLRVGDMVEVGGVRGRVTEIFPFHVVLVTEDNQTVTMPNSMLTANVFRNQSTQSFRRMQWSLPLRAGADLGLAKEALRGRLLNDPRIQANPPPRIFVQEWNDDKCVLAVQAWTAAYQYQAVQEDLLEGLHKALGELHSTAGKLPDETPSV